MADQLGDVLVRVYGQIAQLPVQGRVADYIPVLADSDPNVFGVHLATIDGQQAGAGDYLQPFSIQSIAKVFALALAYRELGETIWDRVGVEPSGTPFNSLVQLEADNGIPRNPFINAGALVICDILLTAFEKAESVLLDFIRDLAGLPDLHFSEHIAASEKSVGFRNVALCNLIKAFGNIHNEPSDVLDFYYNLCSIEMNCRQLSASFLPFANGGCTIADSRRILSLSQTKRINALMQSCGFYDESGEFTFKVGLPGKSGVGGGIIAVHPGRYTIAVWSPPLNAKGNSWRGMRFLEQFTTETSESIF